MDWLDIKEFLSDTIKYIIFIVVILVIAVYVVGLQQIVGPSMTPTLRNGDIVILDKLSYRFSEIKRDDIVALYYADTKFLVKRVVGLPGETVEFKDNKLYINGKYYEEKYLGDDIVTDNFSLEELNYTTIPDDMYIDEFADICEDCGAEGIVLKYDENVVHVDMRGQKKRYEE